MSDRTVWVGIIVGLLGMSVATQAILLVAAIGDPSFAVEPDYEHRAANWDEIREQELRGEALGWQLELQATPASRPGEVDVTVTLLGPEGRPLAGARVELLAFHNARASDTIRHELAPGDPGRYGARLPLRRSGLWEFRVSASVGADRLTRTIRRSVISVPRFGERR